MLTLKSVKVAKNLSHETLAYTANLYWKGKKVGDAENGGSGGSTMVCLHGKLINAAQKKEMESFVMAHPKTLEWQKEYPPAKDKAWTESWEYYLEILVDHLAYEIEDKRDLKRRCRGKTIYRLKGDAPNEEWVMKVKFDAAVKAHLVKKYGNKLELILNETI